jgi:hypothetical protein
VELEGRKVNLPIKLGVNYQLYPLISQLWYTQLFFSFDKITWT